MSSKHTKPRPSHSWYRLRIDSSNDRRTTSPIWPSFAESLAFGENLGERIGGGAGERRNCEQTGADDSESEKHSGEFPGQREEGLRRVLARFDFGNAMPMQSERGDKDDEIRHEIRN